MCVSQPIHSVIRFSQLMQTGHSTSALLRLEPLPIPRPTKQLPEKQTVTIAAGFYCNEGIVLCADSQTTASGYIKNYDGKIRTF
jgi:hypothetical protein